VGTRLFFNNRLSLIVDLNGFSWMVVLSVSLYPPRSSVWRNNEKEKNQVGSLEKGTFGHKGQSWAGSALPKNPVFRVIFLAGDFWKASKVINVRNWLGNNLTEIRIRPTYTLKKFCGRALGGKLAMSEMPTGVGGGLLRKRRIKS